MNTQPEISTTSDERLMAALAHFFGLIVALILWATQKDKSRFVRFQAVQAIAFDAVVLAAVFLSVGCMMILIVGSMLLGVGGAVAASELGGENNPLAFVSFLAFFAPFLAWCPMMLVALGTLVGRVTAAISVLSGRDFRYPVLGAQVEKFLG